MPPNILIISAVDRTPSPCIARLLKASYLGAALAMLLAPVGCGDNSASRTSREDATSSGAPLQASSDSGAQKKEGAIRNFQWQGIRFGTSVEELKKRFPQASISRERSYLDAGHVIYSLPSNQMVVDTASVQCFSGRVFEIDLVYLPSTVQGLHGVEALLDKLENDYGQSDKKTEDVDGYPVSRYIWQFPAEQKGITLNTVGGSASVSFIDLAVLHELAKRVRATRNVGF